MPLEGSSLIQGGSKYVYHAILSSSSTTNNRKAIIVARYYRPRWCTPYRPCRIYTYIYICSEMLQETKQKLFLWQWWQTYCSKA